MLGNGIENIDVHILIVDDNPNNLDLIEADLLGKYILHRASNGFDALEIANGDTPIDLILLDVLMPGLDGFDVCKKLKDNKHTREIPVIFLTAANSKDALVKGFQMGAVDYLGKPFSKEELRARIDTHVTIVRQRRELLQKQCHQRELIHILCHDLANPMTALSYICSDKNLVEELAEDLGDARFETLKEDFGMIESATGNCLEIIKTVRDMSSIEYKGLKLYPVDLNKAMDKSLLIINDRLKEKNIKVQCSIPGNISIVSEPITLVNTIITNILTNAIKFSYKNNIIQIYTMERDETTLLIIKDFGTGMSPAVLRDCFDVNKSVSRQGTMGEKGTGFGMPLVKETMKSYNGDIELISEEGIGTEVRLTFQNALADKEAFAKVF